MTPDGGTLVLDAGSISAGLQPDCCTNLMTATFSLMWFRPADPNSAKFRSLDISTVMTASERLVCI
jgi:hypothetical protein